MLKPNNKQRSKLFECAGVSRWAYNWTLQRQKENYEQCGKFIKDGNLRKELTQLKKTAEYGWLNKYSVNIPKKAIVDACDAYIRFFKGLSRYPRFKSKRKCDPKFCVDNIHIKFTEKHVKLEKLTESQKKNKQKFNWIKLAEINRVPFGENVKYVNPRVSFDGLNWWISVGVVYEDMCNNKESTSDGIGIDLGIKNLAVCSNGVIYKNINKTKEVKRFEKILKRKQRNVSKKYEMNKNGNEFIKTKNIIKYERKIKLIYKRLNGIRHNHIHQMTSYIVKREPSFIVIEDLNVSGMMKNKHLSKAIQQQCFYKIRRQLEYKSNWNGIKLIIADRYFPSSKLCSKCGQIKKDLKLSDRIYKCDCGNEIDRDLQASINLREYGKRREVSV